jgi:hypothetical protein
MTKHIDALCEELSLPPAANDYGALTASAAISSGTIRPAPPQADLGERRAVAAASLAS